jgi:AraC-like DNA-binding protein
MGFQDVFPNSELADDDFLISLSDNQLPLGSLLAKAGRCFICYCVEGSADVEVNLTKHRFEKSEIMVLFPSQIVEQKNVSNDFEVMHFSLAPHILQEVTFRFPPSFLSFLHQHFYYKVGEEAIREEQIRFNVIREKFSDTQNFCRREILINLLRIYFLELYDKILKKDSSQSLTRHNRKAELYENFCNLVMQHHKKHRDVRFYADALNISSKYLSIITFKYVAHGAKQWIDDYVLLELKILLKSSSDSLQKIADDFNFADLAFMSNYFKAREGMSPGQYRKIFG